ncbi:amidase [Nitratireductor sp. ZSWI3]|uniref:amidase n=1 Tax=Nitratireductor sp. ZSWI3 TaxID=2966359 RepID=UPI00214F83C9|nr:amidase [Nitratireductor sp. ZSWI3]MCR4268166.1 amidase [Nitratireductor sp. ZSWI3]
MDLTELSAGALTRLMAEGKTCPSEVMAAFLDRIEAVNGTINAVVALRPRDDLMAEARAMDGKAASGPLHGLPIAVKDLLATKGIVTTWGSPIHASFVPGEDALAVARMKAAGAIVIGKTNTPEWGHGSHSFNPVYGVTRNPYDTTRSAGGSSGGTAAALAARMQVLADGSDMMGSLRNPAAFCNVYGFRPTWGLVPTERGGDTFFNTMATLGPMARAPEDLVRLLDVMAQPDPAVPFDRPAGAFLEGHRAAEPRGMRIGWLADWGGAYPCEAGILEACEGGMNVLEALGAAVEPVAPPFPAEQLWQAWTVLRSTAIFGSKRDLWRDASMREMIKPETLWEIECGAAFDAEEICTASQIRSQWYAAAQTLLQRYDFLVMPSAQVWPFPAEWRWPRTVAGVEMDTYHRWMEVVVPVSLIGLPSLCVPVGFNGQGLPTGMQIIGATGSDARVLALGAAYHEATQWPQKSPPAIA